jgi:uncharacterized membrane protein (DUF373 family)
VRTVILLAMLAIVRKLIILDLSNTEPLHLLPWPLRLWPSARFIG